MGPMPISVNTVIPRFSCDTFSTWRKCRASKDLSADRTRCAHLDGSQPGRGGGWKRSRLMNRWLNEPCRATRRPSAKLCAAGNDGYSRLRSACWDAKRMRATQRRKRFYQHFVICADFEAKRGFRRGCTVLPSINASPDSDARRFAARRRSKTRPRKMRSYSPCPLTFHRLAWRNTRK